jgi:hypothetical protein
MATNKTAAPDGHREAARYLTQAEIIDQFCHAMQASGITPQLCIVLSVNSVLAAGRKRRGGGMMP